MKPISKTLLLLCAALITVFSACENKEAESGLSVDEVNAIWTKIDQMWETQDATLVGEIYAETFSRTSPSGVSTSAEELDQNELGLYRSAFPDMTIDQGEVTISGNTAVVQWTSSGTFSGPFGPMEPNNARFENTGGISVLTIEDGKVTKDVTYINQLVAWMEMGYMLAPVPAEAPPAEEGDENAENME